MIDVSQFVFSIETQRHGEFVIIRPRVESHVPVSLHYHLIVRQQSRNGTINLQQDGDWQDDKATTSVRLSLTPGAACLAHLEWFEGEQRVKTIEENCAADAT